MADYLRRESAEAGGLALVADDIRVAVTPAGDERLSGAHQREADVVFKIGNSLRVGYRGYYRCVE